MLCLDIRWLTHCRIDMWLPRLNPLLRQTRWSAASNTNSGCEGKMEYLILDFTPVTTADFSAMEVSGGILGTSNMFAGQAAMFRVGGSGMLMRKPWGKRPS